MHRRDFQKISGLLAVSWISNLADSNAHDARKKVRKFSLDLCPGRIGVKANQSQLIDLASKYGFESVEPLVGSLQFITPTERETILARLDQKKLKWGAAGLPVEFRKDAAKFDEDLKTLPAAAKVLQAAGVTRIGTWISSSSDELTYIANFRQHAKRLRAIGTIFADHGLRFGLEYVGPKTSWSRKRFPFIHTLNETLDLIGEIGLSNIGIILDSWHWYTAGEDLNTLEQLVNEQIVAVDLNDAPRGLERDQQIDSVRELPAATGVIDIKTFLQYLVDVEFDGPVRAEPFNKALNELDDEPAVEATSKALLKALATLE